MDKYEKMIQEFPALFTEFPRYGGTVDCSEGWFDIIYGLTKAIAERCPEAEVCQIKEKFGGLRYYVENIDEECRKLVAEAEAKAYHVCEVCGSREDVKSTKTGWIRRLCRKHREELG